MPGTRSQISLERIVEVCERFYEEQGFVRWSDVAKIVGVSRQAIQLRLKACVERGELSPEDVERWQSLASRTAAEREAAAKTKERRREREKEYMWLKLSPENQEWVKVQAAIKRISYAQVIDGLINKVRAQE